MRTIFFYTVSGRAQSSAKGRLRAVREQGEAGQERLWAGNPGVREKQGQPPS